jgi:hypothetical protein
LEIGLTRTYVWMHNSIMPRQKLTLSIDSDLIERIKIQAVREKRDVSDITEDLFRQYLKELEEAILKPKRK